MLKIIIKKCVEELILLLMEVVCKQSVMATERLCNYLHQMTLPHVRLMNMDRDSMNIQRVAHEYLNYDGACGQMTRQLQIRNK